jgi:hypothetical protein
MPLDCTQRLAISRKVAGAIDTLCSLQRYDSQHTNDPPLALKKCPICSLAQSRAELLEAECALHDHISEHGCGLKENQADSVHCQLGYPVG